MMKRLEGIGLTVSGILLILSLAFVLTALGYAVIFQAAHPKLEVGRYHQFGMGPLVIDTTTGKIYDTYPIKQTEVQHMVVYPPCE